VDDEGMKTQEDVRLLADACVRLNEPLQHVLRVDLFFPTTTCSTPAMDCPEGPWYCER
jgi:hypothetical protein